MELRPYQIEAGQQINQAYQEGHRAVLIVMATGTGKTAVFANTLSNYPKGLVIAHRRELITQAHDRIYDQLGIKPGIEMAGQHSNQESIIVASVQTLNARPLVDFNPDLVVVDEAHHAVSPTYQKVLSNFPEARILGVTATPDRADYKALGSLFTKVAFRYETPQAIEDGWLAPIVWAKADGIDGLLNGVEGRKTVVFTSTVAEAQFIAMEIGSTAGVVYGALPGKERISVLDAFRKGEIQFIVNCNILTEGWDCPDVECVAMLRSTKSRAMFMQTLGRGLRLAPGKVDCLYLDLTLDMPEHSLEGPDDALDGEFNYEYEWPVARGSNQTFWERFMGML